MKMWYENEGRDEDVVLSTKASLVRNIKGYNFPSKMDERDAKSLIAKVDSVIDRNSLSGGLAADIISSGEYDYLLLDYPFAYRNDLIRDYIDCAVFIDTPLDIAMARRILRDMNNASADEIREEMNIYLNYARIAYVQMLKDIKPSSDYVVDGTQNLKTITEELLDIIVRRGEKP